eukprot:4546846-Lingulodinium_polyedra.AAC.1
MDNGATPCLLYTQPLHTPYTCCCFALPLIGAHIPTMLAAHFTRPIHGHYHGLQTTVDLGVPQSGVRVVDSQPYPVQAISEARRTILG